MTGHQDYTEQEWHTVLQGPPMAGTMVIMAQRGGTFRETFAMSKAYVEARKQHGASQLLDEIVSAKPKVDHTHYSSVDELSEAGVAHLREAVEVLSGKATPDEVEDYRRFVLFVAQRVAGAHEEDGAAVSPAEQQAIDRIGAALTGQ